MDTAKQLGASLMLILTSIIMVAIIGVLVSGNSQTSSVLQSFASAFSQILAVVVSPMGSSGSSGTQNASTSQDSTVANNAAFTQATGNLQGGLAGVMNLPFGF